MTITTTEKALSLFQYLTLNSVFNPTFQKLLSKKISSYYLLYKDVQEDRLFTLNSLKEFQCLLNKFKAEVQHQTAEALTEDLFILSGVLSIASDYIRTV